MVCLSVALRQVEDRKHSEDNIATWQKLKMNLTLEVV